VCTKCLFLGPNVSFTRRVGASALLSLYPIDLVGLFFCNFLPIGFISLSLSLSLSLFFAVLASPFPQVGCVYLCSPSLAHTASHFLSSETHLHLGAAEEFHRNRGRPVAMSSCHKLRCDSEMLSQDGFRVLDHRDGSSVPDLSGKQYMGLACG